MTWKKNPASSGGGGDFPREFGTWFGGSGVSKTTGKGKAKVKSGLGIKKNPQYTKPYKKRGGGLYETKVGDQIVTITKNDEITPGLGIREWKLKIDGEWHETYRTLKSAKQGVLEIIGKGGE